MNSEVGFGRKVLSAFEENGISFEHMPSGIDTMTIFVHQPEFEGKEQSVISAIHRLASIAIIDENQIGKWYHGVPVVATYDNMFQYVKEQIVDEVFISVPYETGDSLAEVVNRFEDMGASRMQRERHAACPYLHS